MTDPVLLTAAIGVVLVNVINAYWQGKKTDAILLHVNSASQKAAEKIEGLEKQVQQLLSLLNDNQKAPHDRPSAERRPTLD